MLLQVQFAFAREQSCIVDPGTETYAVSAACSTPAQLQIGPTVAALSATTTVETRHFLSGFSNVWDIMTVSSAFMLFIR